MYCFHCMEKWRQKVEGKRKEEERRAGMRRSTHINGGLFFLIFIFFICDGRCNRSHVNGSQATILLHHHTPYPFWVENSTNLSKQPYEETNKITSPLLLLALFLVHEIKYTSRPFNTTTYRSKAVISKAAVSLYPSQGMPSLAN